MAVHALDVQATAAPLLVSVYRVRPWPSTRIVPNLALFAVLTAGAVAPVVRVVALVVLLVELVDEDPQAAAMAAAGTSPRRMARRGCIQGRVVPLDVVVGARITGFPPRPRAGSPVGLAHHCVTGA